MVNSVYFLPGLSYSVIVGFFLQREIDAKEKLEQLCNDKKELERQLVEKNDNFRLLEAELAVSKSRKHSAMYEEKMVATFLYVHLKQFGNNVRAYVKHKRDVARTTPGINIKDLPSSSGVGIKEPLNSVNIYDRTYSPKTLYDKFVPNSLQTVFDLLLQIHKTTTKKETYGQDKNSNIVHFGRVILLLTVFFYFVFGTKETYILLGRSQFPWLTDMATMLYRESLSNKGLGIFLNTSYILYT